MIVSSSAGLFVVWTQFQRRAESIADRLNLTLVYVGKVTSHPLLLPLSYLIQAWRTIALVRSGPFSDVWVQSPPSFLPYLIVVARFVLRRRFRIVVDCHNSALRRPWSILPPPWNWLRSGDRVIVHNDDVYAALNSSVRANKLVGVLEDPPACVAANSSWHLYCQASVLVPFSFSPDEPVRLVLEAARRLPDVLFLITGSLERAGALGVMEEAPENVRFTGYLSVDQFNETLVRSHVVLGVTTLEGVQLSVANEAIGVGKALVLSRTHTLTRMFGEAAVFFDHSDIALVEALNDGIARREQLELLANNLRVARHAEWKRAADSLLSTTGI